MPVTSAPVRRPLELPQRVRDAIEAELLGAFAAPAVRAEPLSLSDLLVASDAIRRRAFSDYSERSSSHRPARTAERLPVFEEPRG